MVFDYDWRLSNFDNAVKLRKLIEQRFPNSAQRIDIIAHSMGGLIARIYIQTLGGADRVQNLIMLGTPHRGSAEIFARLKDGFEHWPSVLSGGLPEIQRTILSFPATFQLLPTYDECCGFSENADPVTASYVDILSVTTWARFSWLPNEFKSGLGLDFLTSALAEARRLKALMAQPIFTDPERNSTVHYIANGFVDTWSRVFFHPATGMITGKYAFKGDGTVILESATNGMPAEVQISLREHEFLFNGQEAELIFQAALSDKVWHKGPLEQCLDTRDATNRIYKVCSASFEVAPRVTVQGSVLTITLTLTNQGVFDGADFSNSTLELTRDGNTIRTAAFTVSAENQYTRTLRAQIKAPEQLGAYSVRAILTGLQPFETIFAVTTP